MEQHKTLFCQPWRGRSRVTCQKCEDTATLDVEDNPGDHVEDVADTASQDVEMKGEGESYGCDVWRLPGIARNNLL